MLNFFGSIFGAFLKMVKECKSLIFYFFLKTQFILQFWVFCLFNWGLKTLKKIIGTSVGLRPRR